MEGHAVHDDAFYVPKEMFEEWAKRDLIERYRDWLRANAEFTDDEEDGITADVKRLLNEAIRLADESPLPDVSTLTQGVYATPEDPRHSSPQVMAELTYLQAISDGLRQEMRRDKRVFVIGEDVGVYGGAFKVTQGFQEEFGPWRVIDAPLSRRRSSAAAPARRSWACARWRRCSSRTSSRAPGTTSSPWPRSSATARERRCRSSSGCRQAAASRAGRSTRRTPRARSPTSQASSASARPRPRTRRACSSRPSRTRTPCFFEHKHLYRRIKGEVPEERYTVLIGKARLHREGDDVSVITWGAMVYTAAEAAEQLAGDGISMEIVDLRSVMPWDRDAVLQSVRKTSKALVLHEDTHTGGFGAEIAATIAEEAFDDLDGPVRRITAPDCPVPFSPVLEKAYIPQVEDVVTGVGSWRSTDGHHCRRRRHAPDGRVRLGGDDPQVAEAGG